MTGTARFARNVVLALPLTGCVPHDTPLSQFFARLFHRPPAPALSAVKYVVGPGYPAGGVWYYPQERFSYTATGIAEIMAAPPADVTADGETYDASAMAGAHQILQLPVIVQVTNLSNGRQVLVRLNARGPASPARVLGVTPRVAELLGFAADGTAPVRIEVETGPSQVLARQLNANVDRVEIATAPRAAVRSDALPPPPGALGSAGRQAKSESTPIPDTAGEASLPLRLPETVVTVPISPGAYWIEAGRFGLLAYARQRAAQLADTGAREGIVRSSGETSYIVRIGPIDSVARVDSLMQQVVRDGVSDAHVVVE